VPLRREILDDLARYEQPAGLQARWLAEGLYDSAVVGAAVAWPQRRWPWRTAVVDGDVRLTYGELGRAVASLTAALREAGVGRGDVVAWQAPNWWESIVVALAAWRLGAINNPILMIYREHELRQILADLEPAAVVAPASFRGIAHQELLDTVLAELGHVPRLRLALRGTSAGWRPFEDLLAASGVGDDAVPAEPDDPCVIAYTSGTTARAKGVIVNSRQFLAETRQMAGIWGIAWDDRTFMPAPLAHLTGLTVGLSVPFSVGGSVALLDVWDPERALQIVEAERAVFSSGTPTLLEEICNAYEESTVEAAALRQFSVGGAAVAPRLIERCQEVGISAFRCYGSTEHLSTTIMNAGYPLEVRRDTDGPIAPGSEISCVDEEGRVLPRGEPGEMRIRGPERMMGYVDAGDNAASLDRVEGWFSTGDIGFVDDADCVHFTGRIKDIINRGGEKFSAREMEDVIAVHEAVRQVAVVPLPDERLGEVPAAVLVLREGVDPPGADELERFVLAQGLARAKTPAQWRFVDALPTTPFGKVRKQELISWLTR
jgi:acyl-CoA synthetase